MNKDRWKIIYEVAKLVAIFVLAVSVLNLNDTVNDGQVVIDKLEVAVDGNTKNVAASSQEIRRARILIEDALEQAQETGDSEFEQEIRKGLEQINKLCEQTDCEG